LLYEAKRNVFRTRLAYAGRSTRGSFIGEFALISE
jgi:hypothetical protein